VRPPIQETGDVEMAVMKFRLFGKIPFKVANPTTLIEAFCFQSNFYINYDATPVAERDIQHVNRIGARIDERLLPRAESIIKDAEKLRIFEYDDSLDRFLKLESNEMDEIIKELNEGGVKRLLVKGIGFSKATKILHTFHPETIPMIDNPLQKLYLKRINPQWVKGDPQILTDYYHNFRGSDTWENLKIISKLLQNGLALTEIRIFDILWWSCLKSINMNRRLKNDNRKTINWSTLKVEGYE
jgi:hypothetical protein